MLDTLLLFAITEALFSASPGPAIVMVVSAAMLGGWRTAHAAIFGVLLGNLIYFILSCVLVLGATQYNEQFFFYIKIAGAAYLGYLLLFRYFLHYFRVTEPDTAPESMQPMVQSTVQTQKKLFLASLVMQLANPKTLLFFSAFLPQFVNIRYNILMQFSLMAGLSWMIEYTILIAYVGAARVLMQRFNARWGAHLEHIGNAVMVIAIGWSLYNTFS